MSSIKTWVQEGHWWAIRRRRVTGDPMGVGDTEEQAVTSLFEEERAEAKAVKRASSRPRRAGVG